MSTAPSGAPAEASAMEDRDGAAAPDAPCAASAADGSPAPLGPGALILVVGPSGAGKDTLLSIARDRLGRTDGVLFARRLVTRPPGASEAHGTLTEAEFDAACAAGRFPLFWRAHGLGYALGPEVADVIRGGGLVVANGSRATLVQARKSFSRLEVVLVSAPAELRARRLAARGRESLDDIRERLERAPQMALSPDLEIENTGPPEAGGGRLADFIRARCGAGSVADGSRAAMPSGG